MLVKLLLLLGMSMLLTCCSATLPMDTEFMRETEAAENISAYELRDRLNAFAIKFSNSVERAADQIIAETDNADIKENAMLWKMNSIPAANQAIFLNDPLAALIDITALCVQMYYFFLEGKGKHHFGEHQELALKTTEQLSDDVANIWLRAKGTSANVDSLNKAGAPIEKWAKKYPLEDLSFIRKSVSDTLYAYMKWGDLGLQETVGSIAVSAHSINERLTVYASQLPKLARWQAEYTIHKSIENQHIMRGFENFERITDALDSVAAVIEYSPELANRILYRTLTQLKAERIAILGALQKERIAALADIDRQRQLTIASLEQLSSQLIADTEDRTENLIDHFYVRLLQILILIYIVFIITFIVLRRAYWKPHRN
jgi:hypothetical protein